MPKSSLNVSLKGADDIFSTEESRQEQQREQVQQIPIGELFPFKNHPFKVLDDESMQRTVESVEQYGVLSPLIARPRPEGGYEIISGHRRQHAAQLAGLEKMCIRDRLRTAALFKSARRQKRTSTRMCTGSFWSEQRDLNPRPPRPERGALPTALCPENTAAS